MKFNCTTFILVILFLSLFSSSSFAQTDWTKCLENPIILPGSSGSWDDEIAGYPWILFDDTAYHMWYAGGDGTNWQIGYATSLDGISWVKYAANPILEVGPNGWESESVYSPVVIHTDSIYQMWYSGSPSNQTGSIGYATSPDGITWTKNENNPVMEVGETGSWEEMGIEVASVLFDGEIFRMWYDGWDEPNSFHIGHATSSDGINWTRNDNNPVVDVGTANSWDYPRVSNPNVIFDEAIYHMWYSGGDYFRPKTGYATSPDGVDWTKHEENPVLDIGTIGSWDDRYAAVCFVIDDSSKGIYKMWYSGGRATTGGGIGYAEDFSNVAHSDSIDISSRYYNPAVDTLKINVRIVNPDEHTLTVTAQILNENLSIKDSTELSDNGDGIWSGKWFVSEGEKIYQVGIKTVDEETGMIHNGLLWNIEEFTTTGPVVIDSISSVRQSAFDETRFAFDIYFKNTGETATVKNISATIFPDSNNECFDRTGSIFREVGDIAPGETKIGQNFTFHLDHSCLEDTVFIIPFSLEINSEGYHFWSDQYDLLVNDIENLSTARPQMFQLGQNYPNPFNPTTLINYELPISNYVELTIYNLMGQKVTTLVSEKQQAGYHQVEWDASGFASGVYYYKIEAGEFVDVRKMILIK